MKREPRFTWWARMMVDILYSINEGNHYVYHNVNFKHDPGENECVIEQWWAISNGLADKPKLKKKPFDTETAIADEMEMFILNDRKKYLTRMREI